MLQFLSVIRFKCTAFFNAKKTIRSLEWFNMKTLYSAILKLTWDAELGKLIIIILYI